MSVGTCKPNFAKMTTKKPLGPENPIEYRFLQTNQLKLLRDIEGLLQSPKINRQHRRLIAAVTRKGGV